MSVLRTMPVAAILVFAAGCPEAVENRMGPERWTPKVKQVGDPKANYLNVEFTSDNKYMVWFEGVEAGNNMGKGIVWHCGVDQKTGDLIPPDGRGFRAFESTGWGRANPGCDKEGPYYVGTNAEGNLIFVRPKDPKHGTVTTLATAADPRRRAVYPTNLPDRAGGFVLFILNEKNAGAGIRAMGNAWVELQYINLAAPNKVVTVERQNTPALGFAPMDAGFLRWMRGRPIVTYGSDRDGKVEVCAFDADHPERGVIELIRDGRNKIDPYGAVIGDHEYVMAGIDGTATSHIYRRPAGGPADGAFELFRKLSPPDSKLANPSLAQSHEPFVFGGRLYTVYQVNDRGRHFFETTFRKPGELWLADLSGDPTKQWLIAPDDGGPVAEPEPLVTADRVWIFYNRPMVEEMAAEGGDDAGKDAKPGSSPRERLRDRLRPGQGGALRLPRLALYRAEVPLPVKE